MATAVTTQKIASKHKIQMWDHDPGVDTALITSPDGGTTKRYVDMKDYQLFGAMVMSTIFGGASGVTKVEIVAAEDADGTNLQVVLDGGTVDADAMGDYVWIECTADQIKEVAAATGYNLRYVGARITCSNAGDEAVVMYIQSEPRFPQSGLTATAIA